MRKKRICIALIVLCFIGLSGTRIYAVNKSIKPPTREIFHKGEVVPFEKDYNVSEGDASTGYTIQVLDSKIMTAKDFCSKYKAPDMGLANYYYMVKVSTKNVSNHHVGKQGVALGLATLMGTNYSLVPSIEMFRYANPKLPGMSFSLHLGAEKEAWLVYSIIPGSTPDYKHIKEDPPMLQITQYPHQKLIKLS